ncbi:MAG: alpha/beta fold hydrolase [Lysobacteraceae bacterium]
MVLEPWSHRDPMHGLVLRGWRTPPRGLPLLHVLHGNGLCARTYAPMLAPLAERFDLWLCDAQGHGDSEAGGHFLGWNANAAMAARAFRAHLPQPSVPIVGLGHSFGGVLTALMASADPGLFRRIVLLDPVIYTPAVAGVIAVIERLGWEGVLPLVRATRRRRTRWASRDEAFDRLRGRGVFADWRDEALRAYVDHGLRDDGEGVALKCPPRIEAAIFGSGPRGLWSHLDRLATPTLLVHGDRTLPFVAPSARRLARRHAHVRVDAIAGSHCFMLAEPEATAARVADLLGAA